MGEPDVSGSKTIFLSTWTLWWVPLQRGQEGKKSNLLNQPLCGIFATEKPTPHRIRGSGFGLCDLRFGELVCAPRPLATRKRIETEGSVFLVVLREFPWCANKLTSEGISECGNETEGGSQIKPKGWFSGLIPSGIREPGQTSETQWKLQIVHFGHRLLIDHISQTLRPQVGRPLTPETAGWINRMQKPLH